MSINSSRIVTQRLSFSKILIHILLPCIAPPLVSLSLSHSHTHTHTHTHTPLPSANSIVGAREQTRNTDPFEDRLTLGAKTICWNTKRFCFHVASWFSKFAEFYQKNQYPEAAFRKK